MNEVYLHVISTARRVQLATSHENLTKSRQARVGQIIVDVVPTQPFAIKKSNCLSQRVLIPKRMKVGAYSAAFA